MDDKYKCRFCNSENTISEFRNDKQQFGTKCYDCNKYTFQPKEESKHRESKHHDLVKKRGINYCECCLRDKNDIPTPSTLEGHHVIEYKDNGTDDMTNVWVLCTSCHKLVHHQRTYLGHYKKINKI